MDPRVFFISGNICCLLEFYLLYLHEQYISLVYNLFYVFFFFFFFLSTCHFCFSRRFILTVTAFTVLFTAWYRPNCIFTYSCYHFKNNNLLVYQLLRLTPALLCCTAPRTARWIWRSINKIIIKCCRPLSFSNDLIAQVCQLCHHLTVIIDGLDKLDVEIVRTGCFIVVDMSDSFGNFCW